MSMRNARRVKPADERNLTQYPRVGRDRGTRSDLREAREDISVGTSRQINRGSGNRKKNKQTGWSIDHSNGGNEFRRLRASHAPARRFFKPRSMPGFSTPNRSSGSRRRLKRREERSRGASLRGVPNLTPKHNPRSQAA
ncbi:hypothetical protein KM043_008234 [Ampulex compressa]|nr:hypothetical protein KM043_008234 [Ampulex compressa]